MSYRKKSTTTASELKNIPRTLGNGLYHAAIVVGLTIVFAKVDHMLMKTSPSPQLDKINGDSLAAIGYITLAILTKDYLVKQDIVPVDIVKI